MLRSRVIGTGSYVPARVLTNHDLEKMVETSDDWIATRTGIKERRIAVDEPTSDMASKAAKAALKAAGVQAKDIDLACDGVSGWKLYELAARLEEELHTPLDIVSLSPPTRFTRFIEANGKALI